MRSGPAGGNLRGNVVEVGRELSGVGGKNDQALLHRPVFEAQQPQHGVTIERVAAKAKTIFGSVGDDATPFENVCRVLQFAGVHLLNAHLFAELLVYGLILGEYRRGIALAIVGETLGKRVVR